MTSVEFSLKFFSQRKSLRHEVVTLIHESVPLTWSLTWLSFGWQWVFLFPIVQCGSWWPGVHKVHFLCPPPPGWLDFTTL